MLAYIARRILWSIPVILLASFLTFVLVSAAFDPTAKYKAPRGPGSDPAEIQKTIAEVRERTGTDKPLVTQYWNYMKGAVRGDFGESWSSREQVSSIVSRAFGNTMQLIVWGIAISAVVAISIGVFSAVRQYSKADYVFTGLAYVGIAFPAFSFALLANELLAIQLNQALGLQGEDKLFFITGLHSVGQSGVNLDYFKHLALPVMCLTVQIVASWSRYQRASMLEVLGSDYVRTARAKGVPRRRVIMKHALRNALIPIVTVMALDIGLLFGGLIITERIYSIPGMGKMFLDNLQTGNLPVIMTYLLITAFFVILFNLIADLLYSALDPRIRL